MREFLRCKSVGGGMMQLLQDYCVAKNIVSPIHKSYGIDDRVSFEKWLKTLQAIYIRQPISGLGVEIGRFIQPSHVGVLAYLAHSCENLAQFFQLSSRYIQVWYNFTPIQIIKNDREIWIEWEQPPYLHTGLYVYETAIAQELLVSILWHRLEQLIGQEQVRFNSLELAVAKPADLTSYHRFKCPIKFETEKTRVALPLALLNIQLEKPDAVLFQILHRQADISLEALPEEDNFVSVVNRHILEAIPRQRAYIDYVAEQMHLTSRQLNAQLKNYHLSFQQCLNQIREQLAKHYLDDPEFSILDISLMLSYSEPASFNRAFKSWTGMNPSQWRCQHAS